LEEWGAAAADALADPASADAAAGSAADSYDLPDVEMTNDVNWLTLYCRPLPFLQKGLEKVGNLANRM
jgi:hypothetical protein